MCVCACFLFCFFLVVAFTWIPRVPRGFNLIQSHLIEMLLDDRQGFTARSARRKKNWSWWRSRPAAAAPSTARPYVRARKFGHLPAQWVNVPKVVVEDLILQSQDTLKLGWTHHF